VRPPGDVNPRRDPPLDFPNRALGELTPGEYDALGFMAGLEVHQQLHTTSKLFCRCPAGRYVSAHDAEVLRHMRPTLSELGEYDGTALMEFKTKKEIVYRLERSSVCTYEIDDTPPFPVDDEAVRIAIEVALLLNLNLVSELHVMRKQYLDGSIPTGFQRTAMVGLTGTIPFQVPELGVDRPLSIRQLSLEEDSCREISDVGHRITYRTDRLGMPLIETVTEPEFRTPLELQAGARLLARVAQATRKVRRGPGAARQDVNVSVAGGRRVEIKGVHYHRHLPLLVHIEGYRQLNLLRVRAALAARGLDDSAFGMPPTGIPWEISPLVAEVGDALGDASHEPIRDALGRGDTILGIRLPGCAGLLHHPTQPGRTFVYELAERVRVIACPTHRPFLIDSDQADSDLRDHEWRTIRSLLKASAEDAIVVLWAPADDAKTAAREILLRMQEAVIGVPAETRQAHPDGTTGFERILPGPDRMYPDTDTPPLPIADGVVTSIQERRTETPWDRELRYRTTGLDARAAHHLAGSDWADLFDDLVPAGSTAAGRLASALEKRLPFHRRGGHATPSAARLAPLVEALDRGSMRTEAADRALDDLITMPDRDADTVLNRYRPTSDDDERLDERIRDVVREASSRADRPVSAVLAWAMGEVVPRFLGRVDPRDVESRLRAALEGVPGEAQP
jgi:glutamyl-tRNA(Gln) amidotransferase subunit E